MVTFDMGGDNSSPGLGGAEGPGVTVDEGTVDDTVLLDRLRPGRSLSSSSHLVLSTPHQRQTHHCPNTHGLKAFPACK